MSHIITTWTVINANRKCVELEILQHTLYEGMRECSAHFTAKLVD
ncbi:hypothetical protein JCM19232_1468 [Vibrio ishigakensis]|uniref:Uncharacterized protein n=1 Tax=Vibrio ishigakensis TaxID=1481914 RepID=A0A0B8PAB2_9VIBR|nr:hypothetical protein JCM19232_1468 [Vibrio ishigakensis]